jgi:hypothetical protein
MKAKTKAISAEKLAARTAKLRDDAKKRRAIVAAAVRALRALTDKELVAVIRSEASKPEAFGSDFASDIKTILTAEAESVASMRLSKPRTKEARHGEKIQEQN